MVNNKQVNIWRGDAIPPTIYHVWIYDTRMLLYNGTDWVVFLDDAATINKINALTARVDQIDSEIDTIKSYTINTKPINTNPVLSGSDIKSASNGTFIEQTDSLSDALSIIDTLLTSQIIE